MLRQIGVALLIAVVSLALAAPSLAKAREIHKDPQGRAVWTKQTLEMKIKAAGDVAEIKTVELWYRLEGGEWTRGCGEALPTDTPGVFRVKFTAPHDGVYEFFSVSIDKAGNGGGPPKADSAPMLTIRFDYNFPEISLAFAGQSETVKPGEAINFDWSASDAAMKNARIVYYFDDNEQDAKSINLSGECGTGEITVPEDGVDSVTIYMVAEDFGGLKTVSKKKTFRVERTAAEPGKIEAPRPVQPTQKTDSTEIQPIPEKNDTDRETAINPQSTAPAESPTPNEDSALKVTIRYNVTTVGLSGLDRVELWVARVEGEEWQTKNWSLYETSRETKGKFVFVPEEIGHYAFYVVAGNRAGLWSRPRPDGNTSIKPDYSKWIDNQKPSLRVLSPDKDDVFRGGARICVRWLAQDNNLVDRPIKIELLRDGKVVALITDATANSGEYEFEAPSTQGSYSIRITATDRAGHTTVETSEAFVVDTCSPKVSIQILDEEGLPIVETPADAGEEKSCAPEQDEDAEEEESDRQGLLPNEE